MTTAITYDEGKIHLDEELLQKKLKEDDTDTIESLCSLLRKDHEYMLKRQELVDETIKNIEWGAEAGPIPFILGQNAQMPTQEAALHLLSEYLRQKESVEEIENRKLQNENLVLETLFATASGKFSNIANLGYAAIDELAKLNTRFKDNIQKRLYDPNNSILERSTAARIAIMPNFPHSPGSIEALVQIAKDTSIIDSFVRREYSPNITQRLSWKIESEEKIKKRGLTKAEQERLEYETAIETQRDYRSLALELISERLVKIGKNKEVFQDINTTKLTFALCELVELERPYCVEKMFFYANHAGLSTAELHRVYDVMSNIRSQSFPTNEEYFSRELNQIAQKLGLHDNYSPVSKEELIDDKFQRFKGDIEKTTEHLERRLVKLKTAYIAKDYCLPRDIEHSTNDMITNLYKISLKSIKKRDFQTAIAAREKIKDFANNYRVGFKYRADLHPFAIVANNLEHFAMLIYETEAEIEFGLYLEETRSDIKKETLLRATLEHKIFGEPKQIHKSLTEKGIHFELDEIDSLLNSSWGNYTFRKAEARFVFEGDILDSLTSRYEFIPSYCTIRDIMDELNND